MMPCTLYFMVLTNPYTPNLTITPAAKAEPTELSMLIDTMRHVIAALDNQSKPSTSCDLHCHFCKGDHFKNNVKSSNSMFTIGSVHFAMMATSPYLTDVPFWGTVLEDGSRTALMNGIAKTP